MADVFANYIRGIQAGQAQQAHQEQQAENKLRMQILKHQIEGLKIQDQVNARKMALEHYVILSGLPEALQPGTKQTNLQSKSLAGAQGLPDVVSSLMSAQAGTPQAAMTAPEAQELQPETRFQATPVNIPGVEAYGIPGMSLAPRSLEDLIRAQMAMKAMEPVTLGPGQRRFVGGRQVAEGGKPTPTRATIALEAAGGDVKKADESLRARTATPAPTVRDVLLDGEQATLKFHRDGKVTDLDDQPIENAAKRIKPLRAPTGSRANPETEARMQYQEFFKVYNRAYPTPTQTERDYAAARGESAARTPPPPSLEKWKVMTSEERQRVLANPSDRITDAEMLKRQKTAPAKVAAPPEPGEDTQALQVGQIVTARGQQVRITKVYPDGSFDAEPVR